MQVARGLLEIMRDAQGDDRIVIPLFRTVDAMLVAGALASLRETDEGCVLQHIERKAIFSLLIRRQSLFMQLLELIQADISGSKDALRIIAAVNVYASLSMPLCVTCYSHVI